MEKQEVTRLFNRYRNDVYRLALSYLCNIQDTEDVCQGVFLKLLEKNITLQPGSEKAWLLTCTANACKNHLRTLRQHRTEPLDAVFGCCEDPERNVIHAVMSLPPKYRIPIHLYYYEGYSQDEIARILNLTRTAVQTRMARARAMLGKELHDYDESLPKTDGQTDPV